MFDYEHALDVLTCQRSVRKHDSHQSPRNLIFGPLQRHRRVPNDRQRGRRSGNKPAGIEAEATEEQNLAANLRRWPNLVCNLSRWVYRRRNRSLGTALSFFRMNTYEKEGRGWPVIVNQESLWSAGARSRFSFIHPLAAFALYRITAWQEEGED